MAVTGSRGRGFPSGGTGGVEKIFGASLITWAGWLVVGGQQNKSVAPASKLNSSHDDHRMGSHFTVVRCLGGQTEGIHLSKAILRHATSPEPGRVQALSDGHGLSYPDPSVLRQL